MTKLLMIFIVLNIVNVIIQTIKSLCTINSGKTVAAIVNALAYGFYTVVIVYTVCDLPLMTKALVVAICNLVGVWVVKYFEEKSRKDKLWRIELTVRGQYAEDLSVMLNKTRIPYNSVVTTDERYNIFNIYFWITHIKNK